MRSLRALLQMAAVGVALLAVALLLKLPAQAAAVLEYFNAIPSSSAVLLEWSTASEYNSAGFELFYRGVNEPRSVNNRLAFLNAKGGPDQGAQYDLLVTDLTPGQAYCFRLEEVTTDDTPGEARERCGYGLGIGPTPVPSPTATLSQTVGLTPTVVLFPNPAAGFPNDFATSTPDPFQPQNPLDMPTPTWTVDPFAQPTPTWTVDPFAQPTPTWTVDPFAQPAGDPFAQPTVDPFFAGELPTLDPFGATPTPDPAFLPAQPTIDPFAAAATIDPFQPQSPLETPSPTWTADPFLPPADAGSIDGGAPADPQLVPTATIPGAPVPTATSLYVVVTAEPTAAAQGIAPEVTPWPTATPPATFQLASLLAPTAQNLTVMLLCFIFLSATGLGFLGLLTSVVYMRSRARTRA